MPSLLSWIGLRGRSTEQRSQLRNPFENPQVKLSGENLDLVLDGTVGNTAGQRVHEDDAMRHSPVWAAVDLISQKIAELPLVLQRSIQVADRTAWREADRHPSHDVLKTWIGPLGGPSPGQMTAQQWMSMMVVNLLLYGNSFCWIKRNRLGQCIELRPVHPIRVQIYRREGNPGSIFFEVNPVSTGAMRGPLDTRVPTTVEQMDMLHFHFMAPHGYWGLSPIRYGARAIGRNMSTEDYISEFYVNDATPGSTFIPERPMTSEQRNLMLRSWRERHEGVGQHHKFAVANVPGKLESMGVSPEGQLIGVLEYGVDDVARIYRIPPHYLAREGAQAYNSNVEEGRRFLRNTLDPTLRQIEAECDVKIPAIPEVGTYRCRFDRTVYKRGETSASDQRQYVEVGIKSRNEVREELGLNPVPGGDEFMTPANMTTGEPANGQPEATGSPQNEAEPERTGSTTT